MSLGRTLIAASAMLAATLTATGPGAAQAASPPSGPAAQVEYRTATVDGLKIFYREAGNPNAPTVLLLHGFPTSSHMYRNLIPLLSDRYHIIAPDLPGFGFSDSPPRDQYHYTFDQLAKTLDAFTVTLHLRKYAIEVFDYGAPVGFRLAMAHPERITAIITQNGNAYEEGLSTAWNPIQTYWKDPSDANRSALREMLTLEGTRFQYLHGAPADKVAPESYTLDYARLSRPGNDEIQLDLFLDYASNVKLYPQFQAYFRKSHPPLLAVWGQNDPFFLPPGAKAFKRDIPDAQIHLYDAGHFALETHVEEIGAEIRRFLDRTLWPRP